MKHVNLFGPVNRTGMGTHFYHWANAMCLMLPKYGYEVAVIPKGPVDVMSAQFSDTPIFHAIKRGQTPDMRAPGVLFWHGNNLSGFCGSPRIGYTVWETDGLPHQWCYHLKQMDFVAVPTKWHRDVLYRHAGIHGAFVWPAGVDATNYSTGQNPSPCWNLVNIGKWEVRKGQRQLIAAMSLLAEQGIQARLFGLWANPWDPTVANQVQTCLAAHGFNTSGPHYHSRTFERSTINGTVSIEAITHYVTETILRDILTSADIGVFPFFAEGWGLPILECMASGVPVICSRWGPVEEYLGNSEGCVWLTQATKEIANDRIFFKGDFGTWNKTDPDEIACVIEMLIREGKEACKQWRGLAARQVAEHLSWTRAAEIAAHDIAGVLQ